MSFIPTKQQLEELGFKEGFEHKVLRTDSKPIYWEYTYKRWLLGTAPIYPESIDDLRILIRMLTPPNN